jgi:hypothetical protein
VSLDELPPLEPEIAARLFDATRAEGSEAG